MEKVDLNVRKRREQMGSAIVFGPNKYTKKIKEKRFPN